jgi:hypothetical protein
MPKIDVRITFTGLCLFLRDSANRKVHVIFPKGGGGVKHKCRVFVPTRQVAIPTAPDDTFRRFHFRALQLDLTALAGAVDPAPKLPPSVPNVPKTCGSTRDFPARLKLPQPNVSGTPIKSRVTLRGGTLMGCQTGHWYFRWRKGSKLEQLEGDFTHQVQWLLRDVEVADPLTLFLAGIDKGDDLEDEPDTDGSPPSQKHFNKRIELHFYNVPANEMPPHRPPSPSHMAHHFGAFWDLLEDPDIQPVMPESGTTVSGQPCIVLPTRGVGPEASGPLDCLTGGGGG